MKKDFPFSVPAFLTFAHCIRDPSRPQTLTSSASCAWASPMRRQHSTGRAACTARSSQCGCLGPQGTSPSVISLGNVPLPPMSHWWGEGQHMGDQAERRDSPPSLQCVSLKRVFGPPLALRRLSRSVRRGTMTILTKQCP